jgi:hypothetical protein
MKRKYSNNGGGGYGDRFILYVLDCRVRNDRITRGNTLKIHGKNIRIAGEHPTVGVYLRSVGGKGRVKLTVDINNSTSCLVFATVPNDIAKGKWRLEIRTQSSVDDDDLLDEPIVIVHDVELKVRAS